jgi:RecA-family ATPase
MDDSTVRGFLGAGCALVRIPLGKKGPVAEGWQREDNAIRGVGNAAKFAGQNVGLLHEWSRTCAVDIDDFDGADAWLTAQGLILEALFMADGAVSVSSGTANRGKLLYRLPQGVPPLRTTKIKDHTGCVVLELRCAGAQDVIAGKHPSGSDYTVTGDPATMPELPPELLMIWRGLLNGGTDPHAGDRQDRKIPEGVRNETLFRLARTMHMGGASEAAILAALLEMNKSCAPPLPEREVASVSHSAAHLAGRKPVAKYVRVNDDAPPALDGELDLTTLAAITPPRRQWAVDEWVGVGHVTSVYGAGGVGKSLLALQMAVALGCGRPFLGLTTRRGRTLALFCEDDHDELHRRLHRHCVAFGVPIAESAGMLALHPRLGMQNAMVTAFEREGEVLPRPLYQAVEQRLEQARSGGSPFLLLVLDNVAQVAPVPENNRGLVTQTVNLLNALALRFQLAVLLLGHPAKGLGSQYSGSTAWDAAVRSRIYMERVTDSNGTPSPDLLTLHKAKANYAGLDALPLRYDSGVYRLTGERSDDVVEGIRRRQREQAVRSAVVAAIVELTRINEQRPTDSPRAPDRYLPKLMAKHDLLPDSVTERMVAEAMPALLRAGVFIAETRHDTRAGRDFRFIRLPDAPTGDGSTA